MRICFGLLTIVAFLSLLACSSSPTANPDGGGTKKTILAGTVHLIGPEAGVDVQAYIFANGNKGNLVGAATTDDRGEFEIPVGPAYGDFLIYATVDDKLLSVIVTDVTALTTKQNILISPYTALADAYFETAFQSAGTVKGAKDDSEDLLFEHFGNLPHGRTAPVEPTAGASSINNGLAAGLILKAMERQAKEALNTATLMDFIDLLVEDLSADGYFDGRGYGGPISLGSFDFDHCTVRSSLATQLLLYMEDENPTQFTAADVAGIVNQLSTNNSVIFDAPACAIDNNPPTVVITSPEDLSEVTGTIDVTATATDAEGHLESITVVAPILFPGSDSIAADGKQGNFNGSLDTSLLEDGDHKIILEARDTSSNVGQGEITIKVRNGGDIFGPTFTWDVPSGTSTTEQKFKPSGKVSDLAGVVEARFDSIPLNLFADGTFVVPEQTLADGENTWPIYAIDGLDNVTNETYTIIRDVIPPDISVTEPGVNQVYIAGSTIDIDAGCSDTYGVTSFVVKVNSSQLQDFDANIEKISASIQADDYDEGYLTLVFTCTDRAGNPSTQDVKIEISKTGGISGHAIKGPIVGAQIRVFDWSNGSKGNSIEIGEVGTLTEGQFTASVEPHPGNWVLVEQRGGNFKGEGRSNYDELIEFGPYDKLMALVPHTTADSVFDIKIHPFTSLATILAENLVIQGVVVDEAATSSRPRIENIYGFDFASDCHNTRTTAAPGFTDPVRCGLLMAGLTYLGEDLGYNALELLRLVFEDLHAERLLDGRGYSGNDLALGDYELDANTMRSKLARAIKQYMADPELNKSGLPTPQTENDIRDWLDGIAANADPIFDPNQAAWPVDIDPPVVTAHVGDEELEDQRWVNGSFVFRLLATDDDQMDSFVMTTPSASPPHLVYNYGQIGQTQQTIDVAMDTTSFADGLMSFSAEAEDRSRNKSSATFSIRMDNTGPSISSISPAENTAETPFEKEDGIITVSGDVFDAGIGVKSMTLTNTTSGYTQTITTAGAWSFDVQMEAGANVIEISAVDDLDNSEPVTTLTYYVKRDLTPPEITITSHTDNQWVRGTIVVVAEATDDEAMEALDITQPDNLTSTLDNTDPKHYIRTVNIVTPNIGDGNFLIEYYAEDHVDNTDTDSVTLQIDNTPPDVDWTAPTDTANIKTPTNTILCSGTINDGTGSGVAGLTIKNLTTGADFSADITGENWSKTIDVIDGENRIEVVATDVLGNSVTLATRTIDIDTDYTKPAIFWDDPTPADGTWTNTNFRIWVNADDPSGLSVFSVTYEGTTVTDNQFGVDLNTNDGQIVFDYTVPDNTEKDVVFTVTAIDNSQDPKNTATENITRTVRVDTKGPVIVWNNPTEGQSIEEEFRSITASVDVTDGGIGVDSLSVKINDQSTSKSGDTYTHQFTGVTNGSHQWSAEAQDELGNTTTLNVNFTFTCSGELC